MTMRPGDILGYPDRVVFHTWAAPPTGHALLNNPQVRPILRVQIDQTTTPAACAASMLALAQRIGADRFGAPAYCMFVQNLANKWGPARGPLSAGLDALSSPTPHAPVPAAASMFTANGVASVRATCQTFYNAINQAFIAASMPPPMVMAEDNEDVDGAGYGNAFVPARIVGRADASATPVGIWQPSLNDARAGTEIVAPGLTSAHAPLTMAAWEAARIAAGVGINPTGFEYIQNADFRRWFSTYARYAWLVNRTTFEAARATWPGVLTCNYNDHIGSTSTRDFFNPAFWSGQRRTFGDMHSPVLYSPHLANLAAAGLRVHPSDDAAEYGAWICNQRAACEAAMLAAADASERKPHWCWVQAPGEPLTGSHTPSVESVAQAIAHNANEYGDTNVLLFGSEATVNADNWEGVGALVARVNQLTARPAAWRLVLAQ